MSAQLDGGSLLDRTSLPGPAAHTTAAAASRPAGSAMSLLYCTIALVLGCAYASAGLGSVAGTTGLSATDKAFNCLNALGSIGFACEWAGRHVRPPNHMHLTHAARPCPGPPARIHSAAASCRL